MNFFYTFNNNDQKIIFRLVVLIFMSFLSSIPLMYAQDNMQAKIAIMLIRGKSTKTLKSNDRVNVGDSIWILVQPLTKVYTYGIYSDENIAVILKSNDSIGIHRAHIISKGDTLILPSQTETYVVDSLNPTIKFSIICGKSAISEIENLFKKNVMVKIDLWHSAEQKIFEQYSPNLTSAMEKPFSIAGNVRGSIGEFLEKQPVFEGKEIIIRTYNIEIKK